MSLSPSSTLDITFLISDASNRGSLRVALFNSQATFEADQAYFGTSEAVDGRKEISIFIPDLAAGTYAIAAFYDRNDNGKLDRNLFGIPNEAYGFIKEPASKWRAPRWDEITTEIEDQDQEVRIELKKWSAR